MDNSFFFFFLITYSWTLAHGNESQESLYQVKNKVFVFLSRCPNIGPGAIRINQRYEVIFFFFFISTFFLKKNSIKIRKIMLKTQKQFNFMKDMQKKCLI